MLQIVFALFISVLCGQILPVAKASSVVQTEKGLWFPRLEPILAASGYLANESEPRAQQADHVLTHPHFLNKLTLEDISHLLTYVVYNWSSYVYDNEDDAEKSQRLQEYEIFLQKLFGSLVSRLSNNVVEQAGGENQHALQDAWSLYFPGSAEENFERLATLWLRWSEKALLGPDLASFPLYYSEEGLDYAFRSLTPPPLGNSAQLLRFVVAKALNEMVGAIVNPQLRQIRWASYFSLTGAFERHAHIEKLQEWEKLAQRNVHLVHTKASKTSHLTNIATELKLSPEYAIELYRLVAHKVDSSAWRDFVHRLESGQPFLPASKASAKQATHNILGKVCRTLIRIL